MNDGQVLLLHSSLSSIGHVGGGDRTVVVALRERLGHDGTLVVPTGTSANSDTSSDYRAAVTGMSAQEVSHHRAAMSAYDPEKTTSNGMGRIAERVRSLPGAVRSAHPHTSFAAIGPQAKFITDGHARDCLLGERSPLARLYDADALVLLLGVGYDRCTAFHLAEYRYTGTPSRRTYRAVVDDGRGREWCEFEDVDLDAGDFASLGADFDRTGVVRHAKVGRAEARLFPLAAAVDFATDWFASHRPAQPYERTPER
ncbi:aminoglycoside N(3)-acetyltransferase [Nonomuraea glycinis]|uniref:aminoglycoside N(3)-acetyltransferase n=1 Tax=Nonomuraea glycinis TaxID=2047744 RepID=UPI002E15188D|nr:AAC(3) family N-acetyltransferase [Nonomuraea glycinis]